MFSHASLAFIDLDAHNSLLILVSREHLRLLRWDRRVPRNNVCHHASDSFNTEAQRRNIKQQNICFQ